jgi:predicted nucleic acid-binding protein
VDVAMELLKLHEDTNILVFLEELKKAHKNKEVVCRILEAYVRAIAKSICVVVGLHALLDRVPFGNCSCVFLNLNLVYVMHTCC